MIDLHVTHGADVNTVIRMAKERRFQRASHIASSHLDTRKTYVTPTTDTLQTFICLTLHLQLLEYRSATAAKTVKPIIRTHGHRTRATSCD